jgi:hypothetical protein
MENGCLPSYTQEDLALVMGREARSGREAIFCYSAERDPGVATAFSHSEQAVSQPTR